MTLAFERRRIAATHVKSLCFTGDMLIDWAAGGAVYRLDGTSERATVRYSYRFDAATATPDGRYAVIYERLGTKGLLLDEGKILRELNRSFYHAAVFEYPVCLFTHGGRVLLAHCPEHYNQLEIEDVATGERLTRGSREPSDFFHSRLQANPSGTRLLSAGWVWHPWDAVAFFDVTESLQTPAALDRIDGFPSSRNVCLSEESSAHWLDDTHVVLGGGIDEEDPTEAAENPGLRLRPRGLAVGDVTTWSYLSSVVPPQFPSTLMPIGETHVVTFNGHPRLIALATGELVHEWPELACGVQRSSIMQGLKEPLPVLARDAAGRRFALADAEGITVISF